MGGWDLHSLFTSLNSRLDELATMTSNTTTKKGATTATSSGSKSKSSSNNSNPKKNPKSKKKQSSPSSTTIAKQSSTQQQQQQNKTKTKPKEIIPKLVATDPPLECTQSDFEALLGDAAGLVDYDEASSELLDCARYGTLYLHVCMHVIMWYMHKPCTLVYWYWQNM